MLQQWTSKRTEKMWQKLKNVWTYQTGLLYRSSRQAKVVTLLDAATVYYD